MIDWDGIMLAPRERDLMLYGNELRADSTFHEAYGVDYRIDTGLISYYNYDWVLQEYSDYAKRLFDTTLNPDARHHALEEFMGLFGGEELGDVVKEALDSPLPVGC
jgi:spectinomycin phosphotransferase